MSEAESKSRQEINNLKAEVRRLRRIIQYGVTTIALAVLLAFPQLFRLAFIVGLLILFALLISPVRHLIFPKLFKKKAGPDTRYY